MSSSLRAAGTHSCKAEGVHYLCNYLIMPDPVRNKAAFLSVTDRRMH